MPSPQGALAGGRPQRVRRRVAAPSLGARSSCGGTDSEASDEQPSCDEGPPDPKRPRVGARQGRGPCSGGAGGLRARPAASQAGAGADVSADEGSQDGSKVPPCQGLLVLAPWAANALLTV